MVLPNVEESRPSLVYGYKFSSVGPGRATGLDSVHRLGGVDLAMKLHYLKGVYFLGRQAIEGISDIKIKESMFYWLIDYFHTCGRLRRADSGRPYLKCNDCGSRFIEAESDKTIAEWLEMDDWPSQQKLLVSQQVIGPELSFSPPILLQVTRFKCGGISLGLSWAHVLGDAFSAADYLNKWAKIATAIQVQGPPKPTPISPNTNLQTPENPNSISEKLPNSLKRVDPVGDHWIFNDTKMETFSFKISPLQMASLKTKASGPFFESLCALIWRSVAKVRRDSEPKNVTLVKPNPKRAKGVVTNSQIISTVEADFSPQEADHVKLATLLAEHETNENDEIEGTVEKDHGLSDFIIYGANLTFVDWQEVNFYGMELQGHKPTFVSFSVQGVGDNGVVFLLPGPESSGRAKENGRLVTLILPQTEISELKHELKKNDLLLDNNIE